MSAAVEILNELSAIGAIVVPAGDRLLLRAGSKPVPAGIIRRLREAKPELLVLLRQQTGVPPGFAPVVLHASGEPSLEEPCAARRGKVVEVSGAFLHFCRLCGRFGAFGYGVQLRAGQIGRWYCGEHRPGRG
jgi:hypothetical protein